MGTGRKSAGTVSSALTIRENPSHCSLHLKERKLANAVSGTVVTPAGTAKADEIQPGDRVRLIANPSRAGILGSETDGPPTRLRVLVIFADGDEQFILRSSLEKVERITPGPYAMIAGGKYGRTRDLRGAVTAFRLSGRLANLIYSLNTTNTQFLAYQFKPVLHFLDSPCNGILIADEVGLGKTIEAGLIWTELRARVDARKLLVICPAMLREKWRLELADRFGVKAEIVDSAELLARLQSARARPQDSFALIASLQGLRPPRGWNDDETPNASTSAQIARLMNDAALDDPLIDMVVVDEAHYMRNRDTQTNLLGRLVRPVTQNLVLLSATPIQLRSTDLFNLLNLIDEDAFPFESSFSQTLKANAPIVALRDRVLAGPVPRVDFVEALNNALLARVFADNEQIEHLRNNPPGDEELASPRTRSEIADRLDRISPLAKVITRTLKRDVQEMRVVRDPHVIKAAMHDIERQFYDQVTSEIRRFCEGMDIATGFMLTIPQRQIASCMAAACSGWTQKLRMDGEELEETAYEIFGDTESAPRRKPELGTLLSELVRIAKEVGDYQALRKVDTKYAKLRACLEMYWKEYPGKKVVLFSFYRHTLRYLSERLGEDGIRTVIVYGGVDKQEALRQFADPAGPDLLLSSEVASEGVDLQFSSLLINYDLPWNPMRIEQRIGRIDRIGQQEEKILIWNFLYADTIDDRVYERLLDRMDIFRYALGSMEAVLGEEIRELGYVLLTHDLTPEQQERRISDAQIAIETVNRQQQKLEAEATHLIAHGDFIQNKVRAAKELGRYISGEDLLAYVRDFLERDFPGARLILCDADLLEARLELSVEAKVHFSEFLSNHRLQGRTAILGASSIRLRFENRFGKSAPGVEQVTQDHPVVRWAVEQHRTSGKGLGYHPVVAVTLREELVRNIPQGQYIFAVARWSVSGTREIERLEYMARTLDGTCLLRGEEAEHLVNTAAISGEDWDAARNVLDNSSIAVIFDECKHCLEEEFSEFRDACAREDRDRITLMVNTLEHHLAGHGGRIREQIDRYRQTGTEKQKRLIPALEGRLKKLTERMEDKIAELRLKEQSSASESFVSGGVIRLM
jgi:hypothetical protein